MTVIVLLICISLAIALIFLGAFIWSYKSGQYDDIFGDSVRFLFDDKNNEERKKIDKSRKKTSKKNR